MSAKNLKNYYRIIYSRLLAFTSGFYPPAFSNNKNGRQLGERKNSHLTSCAKTSFLFFEGMDGWMDDLRFYVLFNSISVITGRCSDDNERLCAMELRLRLRRFHLE